MNSEPHPVKKCTLFVDIDGTLIKYRKFCDYQTTDPEPVLHAINPVNKAFKDGHHIVLTTARPEWLRDHTVKEMEEIGVQYHKLIMGLERGCRILINDNEKVNVDRTFAFNLLRDEGFSNEDKLRLDKILE